MRKLAIMLFAAMASTQVFAQGYPDFTDLIEEASPAVVKINTVVAAPTSGPGGGQGQQVPEILREFFDYYQYPPQPQRDARSVGSGFIISEDGYVLTNNHVVENASQITVRLSDRQEFQAEVVGLDPQSDLALLKIEAEDLPYVEFADPDALEVGDWVVAIGSPFNLDYSASAGIVSAIGRSLPNGSTQNYVPFIQTDVAINPGNSGGPLFNLDGEVVGINSQIFTRSGGYMGLSFAIPSSVAMGVVEQLKQSGSVSRGWLGVVIQEVDRDLAESFGLERPHGALINQVVENSPAARADLRPGDIIVEFDDEPVNFSYELPHIVGLKEPGESYPVRLIREGDELEMEVRIGALDNDGNTRIAATDPQQDPRGQSIPLGLVVQELDPRVASQWRINGGVVVARVAPNSAASEAGLMPGDVIVQLGFQTIRNVREYQAAVAEAESGERLPIRYFRDGNSVFRTIKVD